MVAEALRLSADASEIRTVAKRLQASSPDLVTMECMSYMPETKTVVTDVLGVPILLVITATGRVMREFLE